MLVPKSTMQGDQREEGKADPNLFKYIAVARIGLCILFIESLQQQHEEKLKCYYYYMLPTFH